jgi:hypothetical protein
MGPDVDVGNIFTYSVGPPERFSSEHFTTLGATFATRAYPQPA